MALVLLLVLLWRVELGGAWVTVGYGGGILTNLPWPIALPGDWFYSPVR